MEVTPVTNEPEALLKEALACAARNDFLGALDLLTRVLELAPDALTYNDRGIAHAKIGEHPAAIADFTKALELDRAYALPLLNRGNSKRLSGDRDGAIADFEEFLRREPAFPDADRVRGWIEDARKLPPEDVPDRKMPRILQDLRHDDTAKRRTASIDLSRLARAGRDIAEAEPELRKRIGAADLAVTRCGSQALALHWLANGKSADARALLERGRFGEGEPSVAELAASGDAMMGAAGAFVLHAMRANDRAMLKELLLRIRPGLADLAWRQGILSALAEAKGRGQDLSFVRSTVYGILRDAKGDVVLESSLQPFLDASR